MASIRDSRGRLSDTLALRELLVQVTGNLQGVEQLLFNLQTFADHYRGKPYQLADEDPELAKLVPRVLRAAFGRPNGPLPTCDFLGVKSLAADHESQVVVYRQVNRLPLSLSIGHFWTDPVTDHGHDCWRRVCFLTRQALGIHRLEAALDDLLGASFGPIALNNIVETWCLCIWIVYHLKDFDRAAKFMMLAQLMSRVLPLGQKADARDPRWTCLVSKSAGQIIVT